MLHPNKANRLWLAFTLIVVLGISVGIFALISDGANNNDDVWPVEFSERFRAESLRDIVSFADAVAIVSLKDEREVGLTPEDERRGEGSSAREVTLAVEEILWRRPGAKSPPDSVTFNGLGYIYNEGKRYETRVEGLTDFEAGNRYLVALLDYHEPEGEPFGWGTYSPRVIIPLAGDTVASQPQRGPIAVELAGSSTAEVAAMLERTEAYPAALANPELSATERSDLVFPRN